MFNDVCQLLNLIYLRHVSALLRMIAFRFLTTSRTYYNNPSEVGYQGWVESKIGTLAFIRADDTLQWVW